jgi:hypothetical protein
MEDGGDMFPKGILLELEPESELSEGGLRRGTARDGGCCTHLMTLLRCREESRELVRLVNEQGLIEQIGRSGCDGC